jgi:hypothetical protein
MPRLKDIFIRCHHPDNRDVQFTASFPLWVSTEGTFEAQIPTDKSEAIIAICESMPPGERPRHGRTMKKREWIDLIRSDNRDHIVNALKAWGDTQVRAETKRELRIFFYSRNSATYFKTNEGEIRPNANGVATKGPDKVGEWHGSNSPSAGWGREEKAYEIGIGASIAAETVVTPIGGTPVYSYSRVEDEDEIGEWGERLRSYNSMPWPDSKRGEPASMKSVPYTEANAKFFCDMLHTLCLLSDRFSMFFGSEDVAKLIASAPGSLMLPSPAPAPEIDEDDDL